LFFGLLTLTPLAFAVVIGVLGAARQARAPLALALAALGALAPMVGLVLLAPDIVPDQLTGITLLADPANAATLVFGPVYRLDTVGAYCAFGVAFLVTPLLLWLAWRAAPTDADDTTSADFAGEDSEANALAPATPPSPSGWFGARLGRWQWSGLALALALESAALSLSFAENILWLALCWLLVVALAWGLGELGAEAGTLDWISLGAMALGPLAWLVIILLVALPLKQWRLIDLTGTGGFGAWHVVALGVALACAGGGYPFVAWLRRRAAFAMPAGVGAILLAVLPAALLVGARTYSALRSVGDRWPAFPLGVPPITAGIVMTLLGAASVLVAGLLALGRGDGRGLLALLALAQVGWGLIALGVGQSVSALGLVLLLATSVLGLGAALAALVAGRAVTADDEEPAAGPRIFGARLNAPTLFAWSVGAASLVGAPLFAGFAPQELISAAALPATKLGIPLVGIAWVGDALLALALIRATALAFVQSPAELKAIREAQAALEDDWDDEDDEDDEDAGELDDEASDERDDATDAEAVATAPAASHAQRSSGLPGLPELRGDDLPGVILALLIIALGVAPEWLFALGGQAATSDLLSANALDGFIQTNSAGYFIAIGAQWLPGLAAWAAVLLIALVVLMQARATRVIRPVYLAGQSARDLAAQEGDADARADLIAANEKANEEGDDAEATAAAALALAEPTEAWSDLQPAFTSAWLTPASQWIIVDNDEDDDEEADEVGDEDNADDNQGEVNDERTEAPVVVGAAPGKAPMRVTAVAPNGKSTTTTTTRVSVPIHATVKSPQSAKAAITAPSQRAGGGPAGATSANTGAGAVKGQAPAKGGTNATGANGKAAVNTSPPRSTTPSAPTRPTRPQTTGGKGAPGASQPRPTRPAQPTQVGPSRQAQTPPKPAPKPAQSPRQTSAQANNRPGGAKQQPKPQPKSTTNGPQGGSRKNNQRGGRQS